MDEAEVKRIAHLARIALSDEEIQGLKKDFADILGHFRTLDKLDLSKTPPVSHPFRLKNVFREDIIKDSLGSERLLENAPAKNRSMFQVPQVIENKS
jgi:aspartyl-tRNA(Asn)/glutamyl-tRNA(Gln) amidotransferase subunit C